MADTAAFCIDYLFPNEHGAWRIHHRHQLRPPPPRTEAIKRWLLRQGKRTGVTSRPRHVLAASGCSVGRDTPRKRQRAPPYTTATCYHRLAIVAFASVVERKLFAATARYPAYLRHSAHPARTQTRVCSGILTLDFGARLGGRPVPAIPAKTRLSTARKPSHAASAKAIARNDSPLILLDHLMREELRVQTERKTQMALKRSALFPLTTIDGYDFNFPKYIDKDLVLRAAGLDFIKERANVVFVGPPGVGKTHLANAIAQMACLRGTRVRFTTAADLVNNLVAAQARNALQRRLALWTVPELLVLDELGYLSFDARGADLLYQVFNRRYQRASTIVTTNLIFKEWGKLFHNAAAASAIADRLVHKGILIKIQGKSKRPNEDQSIEVE